MSNANASTVSWKLAEYGFIKKSLRLRVIQSMLWYDIVGQKRMKKSSHITHHLIHKGYLLIVLLM